MNELKQKSIEEIRSEIIALQKAKAELENEGNYDFEHSNTTEHYNFVFRINELCDLKTFEKLFKSVIAKQTKNDKHKTIIKLNNDSDARQTISDYIAKKLLE